MNRLSEETDGICILSLDNGGPGTYSQLLILKEKMSRLASDLKMAEDDVYPADHFDLMGGVGFGGLVAVLLGLLRMNITEAIETYLSVTSTVFSEVSLENIDRDANTKRLREAIEAMLQSRKLPLDAKMNKRSLDQRCKVVLYAADSARIDHPQSFRTYSSRGSSLNPTIIDAVCATMSLPSYFQPVKIGPPRRQRSFVGGVVGANNPTQLLLKEACNIYGQDRRVAQIMSIGCGMAQPQTENSRDGPDMAKLMREMMEDCEVVANELSTWLWNVDGYLRLNVSMDMETMNTKDWSNLSGIENPTAVHLAKSEISEALGTALGHLRERIGTATLGQLNYSSGIKTMAKTPPAVSPYFVLREQPWTKMVDYLVTIPSSQQRVFPITGMGGCGKTQLVSYFLREYPNLYAQVIYVDARSSSSIKVDLQAWARTLGDGHDDDVWEDAIGTLSKVPGGEQWILILDNADDPDLDLDQFLPRHSHLTILITSRNRDIGDHGPQSHLELGEMTPEEALAALLQAAQRKLPMDDEELHSAQTLIGDLGWLAIALVQAGSYCRQLSSTVDGVSEPYTFTQYLFLFRSHRADLLKKAEPSSLDDYQRGVYTTLDISYKALPQECREFLHFISSFHYIDIPLAAFAEAAKNHFEDLYDYHPRGSGHETMVSKLKHLLYKDMEWNESHLQGIVRNLRSFSLVTPSSMNDSLFLQLHPLVRAWSRDMAFTISQSYQGMAIQMLTACGSQNIELNRFIFPHMIDIMGQVAVQDRHINDLMVFGLVASQQGHYHKAESFFAAALDRMKSSIRVNSTNTLIIMSCLASSYYNQGRWTESEKLWMEVLDQRRHILGIEHPCTITAAANLALTYSKQGRWDKSEKLQVEVLEQRRRILGIEHPDTIREAAHLSLTYFRQGRWTESEKLSVGVLEQRRRILGIEHPETITAVATLASIYQSQGRWAESEKLSLGVLEQRKRILGIEHPSTITAAGNLATTYREQGRFTEAEKLEMEVLEKRKRVLGIEHPDTISAALNLAGTYGKQGRWNECEKLEVEVLEQKRRVLGIEHPDTIIAAANLAGTYLIQGRWTESERLFVEVLEQQRRILGNEHPETIRVAASLAVTYRRQGRWTESEKLSVEVLEQRRRILGIEHPDTIKAVSNLASTYSGQGRWTEAEKLEVDVLEQRRRILGMEHPDTIKAATNLASTYYYQGRWSESEKLKLEVLEQRRRILGNEHPDTVEVVANLATIYVKQGRWTESERFFVEVLEQRRRTLGNEHPDTIGVAASLAVTYQHQGRFSESEKLKVEVLEQRRRIHGIEHPDTIFAAANLAVTYRTQGRWTESERLGVEVLEQRRRILGFEHPDTIRAASNLAVTYSGQGRWTEAEKLNVEVLEQRRRILGIEHPDTIRAVANLAGVYRKQGRWTESEKLEVEVLEQRRRVLGNHHPNTILAAANLAATYQCQGRWIESEQLEVEVLKQRKRILGIEHPSTITAAGSLATTYREQGRFTEAEKLEMEVLEQRKRILGIEHPDTIRAASNLASTYRIQGRWTESEKLFAELLEQGKRILGIEHPDTIEAAANLAEIYYDQARWEEAATLLSPTVQQSIKVLGQQHLKTQGRLKKLALAYDKLRQRRKARETRALLISDSSSQSA